MVKIIQFTSRGGLDDVSSRTGAMRVDDTNLETLSYDVEDGFFSSS